MKKLSFLIVVIPFIFTLAVPARHALTAGQVESVGHIGGTLWAVTVDGNYAYLGEGPSLTVLNISSPATPTIVSKTPLFPDIIKGLAVRSSFAFVADGYNGGLRVVDVSDPAHMVEVGFYNTPGIAVGVAIRDRYAYPAAGVAGLLVLAIHTHNLQLPLVMK